MRKDLGVWTADDCAVVLIEPLELADAMTALRKAGMRASSD